MGEEMLLKNGFCFKALAAGLALKRRLSLEAQEIELKDLNCTAIEMDNEIYRVDHEMLLKIGFSSETLAAGLARELLLLQIKQNSQMII